MIHTFVQFQTSIGTLLRQCHHDSLPHPLPHWHTYWKPMWWSRIIGWWRCDKQTQGRAKERCSFGRPWSRMHYNITPACQVVSRPDFGLARTWLVEDRCVSCDAYTPYTHAWMHQTTHVHIYVHTASPHARTHARTHTHTPLLSGLAPMACSSSY